MTDQITFDQVQRLLGKVGFVRTPVKGTHVLYEHKRTGTLLAFRPHRDTESVDPMTLSIVRKTLDENGFLESDVFEQALLGANGHRVVKSPHE